MHGQIELTSELGRGTKATFWIPFNRPQFGAGQSPLVDLGAIPDRLRSEMSVSGCTSDPPNGSPTPPMSPPDALGVTRSHRKQGPGSMLAHSPPGEKAEGNTIQQEIDRKKTHVLVVEDK